MLQSNHIVVPVGHADPGSLAAAILGRRPATFVGTKVGAVQLSPDGHAGAVTGLGRQRRAQRRSGHLARRYHQPQTYLG
jgi:hypothetical protein